MSLIHSWALRRARVRWLITMADCQRCRLTSRLGNGIPKPGPPSPKRSSDSRTARISEQIRSTELETKNTETKTRYQDRTADRRSAFGREESKTDAIHSYGGRTGDSSACDALPNFTEFWRPRDSRDISWLVCHGPPNLKNFRKKKKLVVVVQST